MQYYERKVNWKILICRIGSFEFDAYYKYYLELKNNHSRKWLIQLAKKIRLTI